MNGAVHWDKTQPPAAQILYWLLYSNLSAFLAWFYHSKKKLTRGHVNINTKSSLTLYHEGKFVSPWSKFSLDPCGLVKSKRDLLKVDPDAKLWIHIDVFKRGKKGQKMIVLWYLQVDFAGKESTGP